MPSVLTVINTNGPAAMLWVGGSLVIQYAAEMGLDYPYETILHLAERVAHAVPAAQGFVAWAVTAGIDGVFGLALGFALIPLVKYVLSPVAGLLAREGKA
jgi:predicted DNA repair protein MutK